MRRGLVRYIPFSPVSRRLTRNRPPSSRKKNGKISKVTNLIVKLGYLVGYTVEKCTIVYDIVWKTGEESQEFATSRVWVSLTVIDRWSSRMLESLVCGKSGEIIRGV